MLAHQEESSGISRLTGDQISAAIAGIVVGPLIFTPVACRFGKAFVLFWTMILTMTMNIWSACMTRETQYISFIMSRLFAGLFGSPAITRKYESQRLKPHRLTFNHSRLQIHC